MNISPLPRISERYPSLTCSSAQESLINRFLSENSEMAALIFGKALSLQKGDDDLVQIIFFEEYDKQQCPRQIVDVDYNFTNKSCHIHDCNQRIWDSHRQISFANLSVIFS